MKTVTRSLPLPKGIQISNRTSGHAAKSCCPTVGNAAAASVPPDSGDGGRRAKYRAARTENPRMSRRNSHKHKESAMKWLRLQS